MVSASIAPRTMICAACGYLDTAAPADPIPGDPLRRAADTPAAHDHTCPGCHNAAWADPRLDATAQRMRGPEPTVIEGESSFATISYAVMKAIVWLVVTAALIFPLDMATRGHVILFVFSVMIAGGIVIMGYIQTLPIAGGPSSLGPVRWHLALPPPIELRGTATGPTRALSALLHAPLTGRPCIAYEVGVRLDHNLVGSFESWLLLEQRSCAFAVGAHTFGADTVRLVFEERALLDRSTVDAARIAEFLRERAFSLADTSLVLTETIVEPGAHASSRSMRAGFGTTIAPMPSLIVGR